MTQHKDPTTGYLYWLTFLKLDCRYGAIAHHVSEDGMHSIDIALLPQAKVPCKVAIEVDGFPQFLYETCKLDKGPIATR